MNRRGEVLIENVIFIILNLVFLSIMVLFLLKQGSGELIMEEAYAKQIALIIDSSRPGEIVELAMDDALEIVEDSGYDFSRIVSFNESRVRIQMSSKGGYSYHYFNDVSVNGFPRTGDDGNYNGIYVITIGSKK